MSQLSELFEKARQAHQIGDHHPSKPWVWAEYKPGKFDWRGENTKQGKEAIAQRQAAGGSSGGGAAPQPAAQADTTQQPANPAQTAQPKATAQPAAKPAKTPSVSGGYHPAKPKIKYAGAPKFTPKVPDSWKSIMSDGKMHNFTAQQQYDSLNKRSDDDVLKVLNNTKNKKWWMRQIAYDIAASRGIPEDKIDTSGTLEDEWDTESFRQSELNDDSNDANSDENGGRAIETSSWLEGVDTEKIDALFPDNDPGWDDPTDKRIRSSFNLDTIAGRQKYDAYRDYKRQSSELYDTPTEQLNNLKVAFDAFLNDDAGPLFISTGGAGIGKTYNFKRMCAVNHMQEGMDWVQGSDPTSPKEFQKFLKEHNGKTILYDDADKVITTSDKQIIAMMKKINDTDPDARVFKDPDDPTQTIKWTGKMCILSNKNLNDIIDSNGEDSKAIFSRATTSDIKLSVRETLDLLADRYKTMGIKSIDNMPKAQGDKLRKDVYHYILAHQDRIEPKSFTVRKFGKLCEAAQQQWQRAQKVKLDPKYAKEVGGAGRGWQREVLAELSKGFVNDIDIEKAEEVNPVNGYTDEFHKKIEERKKKLLKNKKYKKVFDLEGVGDEDGSPSDDDSVNDEDDTQEAEKALDFGELTLQEAEDILFLK